MGFGDLNNRTIKLPSENYLKAKNYIEIKSKKILQNIKF